METRHKVVSEDTPKALPALPAKAFDAANRTIKARPVVKSLAADSTKAMRSKDDALESGSDEALALRIEEGKE